MEEINYKEVKELCQKLEIDPTQLLLLESIVQQKEDDYYIIKNLNNHPNIHNHNIEILCKKKYIYIVQDRIQYTFLEVIKQQIPIGFEDLRANSDNLKGLFSKTEDTESFINRMYDKFPKGVKIMGRYLVRSGLTAFSKKLSRFIKEHKYSLETIEIAFDLYISRANQNRWEGATMAEYVIYRKDGSDERSFLEAYCEEAKDYKKEDIINTISGQISIFSKDI